MILINAIIIIFVQVESNNKNWIQKQEQQDIYRQQEYPRDVSFPLRPAGYY